MADEELVGTEVEQAADDSAQAEDAAQDEATVVIDEGVSSGEQEIEPEAVLDTDVEGSEVTPEPEPESAPRLTFDELREQFAEELEAERNTAAQEREEHLRREYGNQEATRQRLQALAKEAGFELENERVELALKNNSDYGQNVAYQSLAVGAVNAMGIDGVERDLLLQRVNSTKPEENYAAAQQLVALSNERIGAPIGRQQILDMSIDEVLKLDADSKLAKSLVARDERRLSAAKKADEIEARDTGNGQRPSSGSGQPLGSNKDYDLNDIIHVARAVRDPNHPLTEEQGAKRVNEIRRGVKV